MKSSVKFIGLLFVILSSVIFSHNEIKASPLLGVDVLITSHEVFYFKVDNGWIGGEVVLLDSAAHHVSTQKIDKRKMMIDFFDLAPGVYTIVLKKGDCDCREEFIYIK